MKIENCKIDNSNKIPRILLVDMNSFFASVEQQANPFLRGRPVGVVASRHPTSCIIAASKEAKELGIKTGTLIYKARKICPKIILIQQDPEKYREVSRRIAEIFYDYTDRVELYSIDEAFLQFSNANFQFSNLLLVGIEIKKRIREEVGEWLTCSVGLAPNKFMAKLAADLQKPDGLTVVWRENLPEIYKTIGLKDLWGINRGWERRLAKLGITSPLQLLGFPKTIPEARGWSRNRGSYIRSPLNSKESSAGMGETISLQNLISLFGKPGYWLWQRVNGLEEDHVSRNTYHVTEESPKSFGHSWVLSFRTADKEKLKPAILYLAEKAARRMRREGFQAYGFYLAMRLVDGTHLGKSKKLKFAINTGLGLYEEALSVLDRHTFNGNAARTRLPSQFGGQIGKRLASSDPATLNLPVRQSLDGGGIQGLKEGDPDWSLPRTSIRGQDCEKDAQRRRKTIRIAPTNNNQRFPADVMHIAVGFTNLVEYSEQQELRFQMPTSLSPKATSPLEGENRSADLLQILDHLNDKYGEFTIRSGLLTYTQNYAPDAIAFGR